MSFTARKTGPNGPKASKYTLLPLAMRQAKAMIASKTTGETVTVTDDKSGAIYSEYQIKNF